MMIPRNEKRFRYKSSAITAGIKKQGKLIGWKHSDKATIQIHKVIERVSVKSNKPEAQNLTALRSCRPRVGHTKVWLNARNSYLCWNIEDQNRKEPRIETIHING
jgi:hypothetical protein